MAGRLPVERVWEALVDLLKEAYDGGKANAPQLNFEVKSIPPPVTHDVVPEGDTYEPGKVQFFSTEDFEEVNRMHQEAEKAKVVPPERVTQKFINTEIVPREKVQSKAEKSLLESSGSDLRKTITAAIDSVAATPAAGVPEVTEPTVKSAVHPLVPKVDPNGKTAVPKNPRVAAVSPEQLLKLRAEELAQDMPEGDTFADTAPDKPTPPHVDPVPTAYRGVDKVAAAEEEIAEIRKADPKALVHTGKVWEDPKRVQRNYAWTTFIRIYGNDEARFEREFFPHIPPIPARLYDPDPQHPMIGLVVPKTLVAFSDLSAAVKLETVLEEAHIDPDPTDPAKQVAFWMRYQPGSAYAGVPMKKAITSVSGSRRQRIMNPRELLLAVLQFRRILPADGSFKIELVAGDDITLILSRVGDKLLLEDRYLEEELTGCGTATRLTVTGMQQLPM